MNEAKQRFFFDESDEPVVVDVNVKVTPELIGESRELPDGMEVIRGKTEEEIDKGTGRLMRDIQSGGKQ